jgi:hypothetical protein
MADRDVKPKRILWIATAIFAVTCGGGRSIPTAPSVPPANIVREGLLQFPNCDFGFCSYQGEARNVGQGCAGNVRGVTRLFNNANEQVGVAEWRLGNRRVRPQEAFLYGCCGPSFPQSIVNAPGTYRTDFSWDNVACAP